ncbi:hypothetical protein BDB01DRAFT_835436 [Pilobolus umbonatus]|nr:hypothetical protein BDB01DRAFT_835436 [Pilobolus umbonatus]
MPVFGEMKIAQYSNTKLLITDLYPVAIMKSEIDKNNLQFVVITYIADPTVCKIAIGSTNFLLWSSAKGRLPGNYSIVGIHLNKFPIGRNKRNVYSLKNKGDEEKRRLVSQEVFDSRVQVFLNLFIGLLSDLPGGVTVIPVRTPRLTINPCKQLIALDPHIIS